MKIVVPKNDINQIILKDTYDLIVNAQTEHNMLLLNNEDYKKMILEYVMEHGEAGIYFLELEMPRIATAFAARRATS